METIDERILKLIDILKFQKKIQTLEGFYKEINTIRQSVYKIKNGKASFTVSQINILCKKYKVNANWIFGTQKKVFTTENSIEI
jgi:hypothetical protein